MKICDNGVVRDATKDEIEKIKKEQDKNKIQEWNSTSYDDAVNREIRKRYSESQEFSILRQQHEKAVEYQEYYDYCEQCKLYVKEQIAKIK